MPGVDQSALNETLMLVSTSCVPRNCHAQIPLINLLCDSGANPDAAIHAAALHGAREAVHALIARGARIDLPVAAALGRTEDARRQLPHADVEARHWPSLWLRISVTSRSSACCLTRAKIQTATIPSAVILIPPLCTGPPALVTKMSSASSSSAAQDWT
jgi:hypothetical protein